MKPKDFEEVINSDIAKVYKAELDMENKPKYKLKNGKETDSLAEKMFDDLEYYIKTNDIDIIEYSSKWMSFNYFIIFYKGTSMYTTFSIINGIKKPLHIVTKAIHQAITQQMLELGWE